jgi:hypothetical protein
MQNLSNYFCPKYSTAKSNTIYKYDESKKGNVSVINIPFFTVTDFLKMYYLYHSISTKQTTIVKYIPSMYTYSMRALYLLLG